MLVLNHDLPKTLQKLVVIARKKVEKIEEKKRKCK